MSKEILLVVDAVSNEKGVEKNVIFEAIEAALASATRKRYGDDIEVRVAIDRATGEYETFRRWKVFADDSKELEEPARELRLEDAVDVDPKAEIGGYVEPCPELLADPLAVLERHSARAIDEEPQQTSPSDVHVQIGQLEPKRRERRLDERDQSLFVDRLTHRSQTKNGPTAHSQSSSLYPRRRGACRTP